MKTVLHRKDGQVIEQTGTSGITITSIRLGKDVNVLIEHDEASYEETVAMIGVLLTWQEELHGENFVAQCFNHYAIETGKMRTHVGERDVIRISGYKDKKKRR